MKRFSSLAFLSFLSLPLALTGCGKFLDEFSRLPKDGNTTVTLSNGRAGHFLSASTPLSGGVMVYATGVSAATGGPSVRAYTFPNDAGGAPISFSVPNGQYKFLVVGWTQSNLTGSNTIPSALRCGVGTDTAQAGGLYSLGGSPVEVSVDVSAANCMSAPFVDNAFFQNSGYFKKLNFTFCAGGTNILSVTGNCQSGNESARFITGSNASPFQGVPVSDGVEYNAATGRLLYVADQHVGGRFELYSSQLDGSGPVMQNHPYTPTIAVVKHPRSAPNVLPATAQYVAFSAGFNVASPDIFDLFLTRVGVPGDLKLTPGTFCSSTCSPVAGVLSYDFTPDGRYLIFIADNGLGQQDGYQFPATVTIASPAVWTQSGHGLRNGDKVDLTTTGSLPTGFAPGPQYYVVNATGSTFMLSSTFNGAPITSSGGQSGVHTVHRRSAAGINIYSVDLTTVDIANGTATVKQLNQPGTGGIQYSGGGGHLEGIISPAAPYPVLFAEQSHLAGRWELYANTPDGQNLTDISVNKSLVNSNPGSNLNTMQFSWSFDGTKVIWIDSSSTGWPTDNTFNVLNGASINPSTLALGPTFDLSPFGYVASHRGVANFRLSRNADILVQTADQSTIHAFNMYSTGFASLSSPTTTTVFVEPNPGTQQDDIFTEGEFDPSNTYFVYTANSLNCSGYPSCTPTPFYRLYSVTVGATFSRVDLTGPAISSVTLPGGVSGSVLTTGTAHGLAVGDVVTLSGASLPSGFSAGTYYYVVAPVTSNTLSLSATSGGGAITPAGGSGTISIIPAQAAGSVLISSLPNGGGGGSSRTFTLVKDSGNQVHALYLGDAAGFVGINRLYDSRPGVPGTNDTHAYAGAPTGNVSNYSVRGAKAYLTALSGSVDGFAYDVSTSTYFSVPSIAADYSSPTNALFPYSLNRLDVPGDNIPANLPSNFAILNGKRDNGSFANPDIWFVPDFSLSAPAPVKLSHMREASNIGFYRVSMLSYATDGGGNPDPATFQPAISSTCLPGAPAGDGGMNSPGLMVPPGPECSGSCPANPFLLAIDVFPLATGCTGTPVRTVLRGLQGLQTPAATSKLKLTTISSSDIAVFLKD